MLSTNSWSVGSNLRSGSMWDYISTIKVETFRYMQTLVTGFTVWLHFDANQRAVILYNPLFMLFFQFSW